MAFCELGGDVLLGKARELADSVGDRVLALIETESTDPQRLISLGADEVLKADIEAPGEWVAVFSDLIESEKVRAVIFPSNDVSNVIAGAVYFRQMGKVGSFLDEADYVDGTMAAKDFNVTGFSLQKSWAESKTSIISIRTTAVPEPFEDNSRYGKVRDYQPKQTSLSFLLEDAPKQPVSSSSELTVIGGDDILAESAKKLADLYHARFLKYSSAIEAIYGPCLAIEVSAKLRDLPEFRSDLISLNTSASPINVISDIAVVNPEIKKIIGNLVS